MEDLELKEKIAQMLIIEIQEKNISEKTLKMISQHKVGGVILFRRNYDTYEEMLKLINSLKDANKYNKIPLMITIDQEGGRVNRMPPEFENIKNAYSIAETGNIENVKNSSKIISKILNKTGINLNYAPVLDIKRFKDNHAIGNRCYGDNKDDVSKYGLEFMKQMQNQNIIPAIKHFPGHGSTTKDSHITLPVITKSTEELENDDLVPFKNAIESGADAIMVGHMIVKDIDRKYPASLSKEVIQKYLIKKYKYNGLIITDDLKMLAIRLRYRNSNAVKLAINAGNDMIIVGYKYNEIIDVINRICKFVKEGKIEEKQINKSVEKITKIKQKYNVNDELVEGINIEQINKEIKELNNEVLKTTTAN